jgi:hypothetical protein
MPDSDELRTLTAWYREFAEHGCNPWIWEARLQMAGELEGEADRIEATLISIRSEARTE